MADASVEEAVIRNCQALLTGNFAQIFADMTPEAMAKISQLSGGGMPGTVPSLTSYDIVSRQSDGDDFLYDVRFLGVPSFGVKARWRLIDDRWKLADFDGYQVDAGGTPSDPSAPALEQQ
jgi:hypothetical protein